MKVAASKLETTMLAKFSAARKALAAATTIEEVKYLGSKYEAIRVILVRSNANIGMVNQAVEGKLRCDREGGRMLKEMEKQGPGDYRKRSHDVTVCPKLEDIGISKMQSSRWQQEATVPEKDFEAYVAKMNEKKQELTTNGLLNLAKENRRKKARDELAKAGQLAKKKRGWNVWHGDIATWQPSKKYDYIITDPPYPKEYLPLWNVLGQRASEWLKDGGMLIAMSGQSYLPDIYTILSRHLDYYWTACYLTPGQPKPLRQVNVNTSWKPLLMYVNGEYKGKTFGDVFKSDQNEKDLHKWGQSESGMSNIVSMICSPGTSILDPFCGSGTTGIAALRQGCLFDGLELDEQNVNISKGRLNDETAKR